MSEATANRPTASNETRLQPWHFGAPDRDPHEIGRKGGIASGLARRLKDERRLEARVVELRNGAAIYSVLRDKRARDAELERARRQADRDLAEADLALLDARTHLDETYAELRRLDAQVEERERALTDDDALDALVVAIGETRLEASIRRAGWFDDDVDEAAT